MIEHMVSARRPDLATEWSPRNRRRPSEVPVFAPDRVEWRCARGHVYRMAVEQRARLRRCPACHREDLAAAGGPLLVEDSLGRAHPRLAAEWHPANPWSVFAVTPGSGKRAKWLCQRCGHVWHAQVRARAASGSGCPACARRGLFRRFVTDANRLSLRRPELVAEWDPANAPLTPDQVAEFSARRVKWICPRGHRYEQRVASRSEGKGCPYCGRRRVTPEASFAARRRRVADRRRGGS